jgi:TolB-like protein/Tfp pilus assembly protein PilF/predicted Ser/Thr protein kinase
VSTLDRMTSRPTAVERISHYRLLEMLGRGAMGEVWLADDEQLPRQVAVKLLPRHMAEDRDAVDRLLREARSAASVDHPNVVTVYEAGVDDGRPFIVMQRVEGETLEDRLRAGPMSIDDTLELGLAITDALAEVHALGIVHRDLKPANIVLSARGPKILDFGVASLKGSPQLTSTGMTLGTPLTMSPEQFRGQLPDNRSDLWSLGVIFYRALTAAWPFEANDAFAIAHRVLNEDIVPPKQRRADVPADLDHLVMKLLRKNPAHRYARAEDVLVDLESCRASRTGARAAEPAEPTVPRLAVLPFEVLSPDPNDAFLAAGLTEDLIIDLTRVQGLRVASRSEVMPYRDRAVPARTLARELNVDYVLLGSVRRAGQRARISAQLVRAHDGHSIWADRFDRTLDDLFDVQAEVSRQIVSALQITLHPGERELLDRAPTTSREAYAFYLRGREALDRGTRDRNFQAEELLKQAIELDPNFALAHAALGDVHAQRGLRWIGDPMVSADRAEPYVDRALDIDPTLFEAHLVRAMIRRLRSEPEPLLRDLERVIAMNPDHGDALEWTGWSYLALGKPEAALPYLERSTRLHPRHYMATSYLMGCYETMHRTEDAQKIRQLLYERVLDLVRAEPDNVHARSVLATTLVDMGQSEAGIQEAERTVVMSAGDPRIRYNAACTFSRAGFLDRAVAQLEEAVRALPTYLVDWPRHDPDLANVRNHPGFIKLFGAA